MDRREAIEPAGADSSAAVRTRPGLRRASAVVLAVLTFGALLTVGLASADPVKDPGELADTTYTPVPHPTAAKSMGWQQVGGAVFDSDQARGLARDMGYEDKGQIPHTVDFFAVSFVSPEHGFAGGAKCKGDPPVPTNEDEKTALLRDCERVPVMYEYKRPSANQPPVWSEVALPGANRGFVGAIAWIDPNKAVAVGGSGCYPRREVVPTPENQAVKAPWCGKDGVNAEAAGDGRLPGRNEQIAGDARAWVMETGAWTSISDSLPSEMTALTALSFSPRPDDCADASGPARSECGVAGGLGQLWTWRDGAFVATLNRTTGSPNQNPNRDLNLHSAYLHAAPGGTAPPGASDFPFRVRGVAFRRHDASSTAAVVAATSGCCWQEGVGALRDPQVNFPRYLSFDPRPTGTTARRWTIDALTRSTRQGSGTSRARTLQDSAFAVDFPPALRHPNPTNSATGGGCPGLVLSAGGPQAPGDTPDPADPLTASQVEASRVMSRCTAPAQNMLTSEDGAGHTGESESDMLGHYPDVSSVRLVAGGGDTASHQRGLLHKLPQAILGGARFKSDGSIPDGLLDWAVGEWSSNHQAVAYTTAAKAHTLDAPYPLDCPAPADDSSPSSDFEQRAPQCKVDQQGTLDQVPSDHVFLLPSYPLNAYMAIGTTGTGWAAGDRGALLQLGSGAEAAAKEAAAGERPKLGSGEPTRLSSREAYDAFRPQLSDESGLVPPLLSQPLVADGGPRLTPWGSPASTRNEPVGAIAMSPDGSEGWAVGPHRLSPQYRTVIYHFDGKRWTPCDALGVPGVVAADPACANLSDVMTRKVAVQGGGVGGDFIALATVPSADGGRSNDFEAVAIVRYAGAVPEVLRYRAGAWDIDRDWTDQLVHPQTRGETIKDGHTVEMVFTGPRDGWLVNTSPITGPRLLRLKDDPGWEHGRWVHCDGAAASTECFEDAADPRLPTTLDDSTNAGRARGLRLTSVGSRVYLYGTRRHSSGQTGTQLDTSTGSLGVVQVQYPMILSIDMRDDDPEWVREFDPRYECGGNPCTTEQGFLNALSVARPPDGSDADDIGWAIGAFGGSAGTTAPVASEHISTEDMTPLLRLDPKNRRWSRVEDPDSAARAYLLPDTLNEKSVDHKGSEVVVLPTSAGSDATVLATVTTLSGEGRFPMKPMVWRNPATGRWQALGTPFSMSTGSPDFAEGNVTAVAPDGRGGAWLAAQSTTGGGSWFYRFGEQAPKPVFGEVPHPVRETITASAAGGDGSHWVATESGTVYRYDRMTGWDRVALKGWDSGGVVAAGAYGIAVGADGEGLVVGRAGRIARIGPRAAALDPAAVLCSAGRAPCATTRTLRSVAIASDGSALAGGDQRAVIWRPPGGGFRGVDPPDVAKSATITGISMPTPDRAWLVTSGGDVIAGRLAGDSWAWTAEAVDAAGRTFARSSTGNPARLHAVSIDDDGHGYAVGDGGVILERLGDDSRWRRLRGYGSDLRSVTLGPGGRGALIGGRGGLILTRVGDEFEVARHDHYFDPLVIGTNPQTLGSVVGVALLPGTEPGQVEAWAVTQAMVTGTGGRLPPPGAVLHYTSDPDDPLMSGGASRVRALPDAPARVEGELDLAAFGKSDCQAGEQGICPEPLGAPQANQLVLTKVRDELRAEATRPDLALLTGDANDVGGARRRDITTVPTSPSVLHERWWETVGAPLERAGVPLFGALGGQDLSYAGACDPVSHTTCAGTRTTRQKVGTNFAWRQVFAAARYPWGRDDKPTQNGLSFREVRAVGAEIDTPPLGGARTHYAMDVRRHGRDVLRLVVVDTSLKSVSGTAGLQNPVRDQLAWLNDVLSRGRPDPAKLPAVVVSETPSYAYDARAGATTDTLADSAAFETVLVKNRVTAVISGRLGWNGLYWLVAPGLHAPCPGGSYQPDPPRDASQLCEGSEGPAAAGDRLAGQLEDGLGHPVPKPSSVFQNVAGQLANIPVAVAASAGGKFGPNGEGAGSGAQGFWRGYTRVRVFPGKDLVPVIEQRPVFDWIGLHANEHTLTPGRRLTLRGYGREPLGTDMPARYVSIDGPAITHRYDLVLADPKQPHLPKVDPTSDNPNGYVPVPDGVGAQIDRQTGVVRYTGRGNQAPVYALAILSVGTRAASWPIVFAPRRSFKAPAPPRDQRITVPPPARVFTAPVAQLPSTPTSNPLQPPTVNLTSPAPPPLPNLQAQAPQTQPPAPPPPPPPPVSPAASALQITPAPVGLNVAPPATVIPPPAPPIQPAPPGGARREARQRQAAAAKSEEGAQAGQEESGSGGENSNSATRYEPPRDLAFSRYSEGGQPSAWSTGALSAAGLGIAGLVLALAFGTLRPGPRRRQPDLPAPAWAWARSQRRRP